MFGTHPIPLSLQNDGFSIFVEREGDFFVYKRETANERKEKIILGDNKKIVLNPVEPLNRPKELSPFLNIEFERTLTIGPDASQKIFLRFPIEIGVFLSGKNTFEVVDIFVLTRPKFTLYGDPHSGIICRYWSSDIFSSPPILNCCQEGIIELTMTNTSEEWQDVSKAIFNAFGMKIYYSDKLVAMKAEMNVINQLTAETDFLDSPLKKEMKKALELFKTKKLAVAPAKFVMREGL